MTGEKKKRSGEILRDLDRQIKLQLNDNEILGEKLNKKEILNMLAHKTNILETSLRINQTQLSG